MKSLEKIDSLEREFVAILKKLQELRKEILVEVNPDLKDLVDKANLLPKKYNESKDNVYNKLLKKYGYHTIFDTGKYKWDILDKNDVVIATYMPSNLILYFSCPNFRMVVVPAFELIPEVLIKYQVIVDPSKGT